MVRRAALVVVVMAAAVLRGLGDPAPPSASADGVAEALSRAADAHVGADGFVWERSGGFLFDALVGRPVLFIGRQSDAPRDLFRARARLTREGRLIDVGSAHNLTETPLGDVEQLVAVGRYAAVVTRALDEVQGVSVFDLTGGSHVQLSLAERLWAYLGSWLETRSLRGLGRIEVVLQTPPSVATIELRDEQLVMALGDPPTPAAVDLATTTVQTVPGNPHGARAWPVPLLAKPWRDVLRHTLGACLGQPRFERAAGAWHSVSSRLSSGRAQGRGIAPESTPSAASSAAPASSAPPEGSGWPPPSLATAMVPPLEGEGRWRPFSDHQRLGPDGAAVDIPPSLLHTRIRPIPEQSSSSVHLVAIDTRQLELRMVAGFDQPRPQTGPRGSGRMPSATVVAAFNGAPQRPGRTGGMIVDRRLLVPPLPRAATVALDSHGRAWLGSWPDGSAVPHWLSSMRQSLDPLLVDGAPLQQGDRPPGLAADALGSLAERSALCLTRSGYLIYGYSPHASSAALTAALSHADCDYALALETSPQPLGFAVLAQHEGKRRAELLSDTMSLSPDELLSASAEDLFYLVARDLRPASPLAATFTADGADQPEPSWQPAVHVVERNVLGEDVRLLAFAPNRLVWQIRPGTQERAGWTAAGALEPSEQERALVAIGLGAGFRKNNRRGLVLDGVIALPMRPELGVLLTEPGGGTPRIGLTVEGLSPPGDATELRLLAEAAVLRSEARILGAHRRRGAACVLTDGTFLVASATSQSGEAAATALLSAGCRRVVELDRGKQLDAFVHRAGTDQAPQAEYEDTVLYGLAVSARGTARRLERHP